MRNSRVTLLTISSRRSCHLSLHPLVKHGVLLPCWPLVIIRRRYTESRFTLNAFMSSLPVLVTASFMNNECKSIASIHKKA